MTTQWPDSITLDGERWPLGLRGTPAPLPRPYPRGLVIEFDFPHTGLYRGYLAHWAVQGNRLYLESLEAYGYIGESDPPETLHELYPGGPMIRHVHPTIRDFTLEDVFGSPEPVWASWVTTELRVAYSRTTYHHTSYKTYCSRWRVLNVENGLIVGDRIEPGETR
ncbi:MAG TPA: hypothetical protein VEZ24_17930 [Microvirga sp.]|nr:hypothetical protein [Microvirga sp.]